MKVYREGLPPMPEQIQRLPVDKRGYPVPWFVPRRELTEGEWDFRVADYEKRDLAVRRRLCWVCGMSIRNALTFVIGPMCAITRSTSEPAVHEDCAMFAVQACRFLLLPKAKYRSQNLPAASQPPPGDPIDRNPGVSCLWQTHDFETFLCGPGPKDYLIHVGNPTAVGWAAQGHKATREEVLESINSGLPILLEAANKDTDRNGALLELHRQLEYLTLNWLPVDTNKVEHAL